MATLGALLKATVKSMCCDAKAKGSGIPRRQTSLKGIEMTNEIKNEIKNI